MLPGDLPRDCQGECRETALSCEEQRRAVSRHSPPAALGRSLGTTPQHSPHSTPIFPGSPLSSLRSSFGGWPAQSQPYWRVRLPRRVPLSRYGSFVLQEMAGFEASRVRMQSFFRALQPQLTKEQLKFAKRVLNAVEINSTSEDFSEGFSK